MRHFQKLLLLSLLFVVGAKRVSAFSLIGPYASWQSAHLGYQQAGAIGGPMNISEGYRWNIPTFTYAFDSTFVRLYGADGMAAIDSAFAMLNALPPADLLSADLAEYGLQGVRVNNTAAALGVIDLKTTLASMVLEHMGLACPEVYTWTLRTAPPDITIPFRTINRNWDPITWEPSAYVNGNLYTYQIYAYNTTPDFVAVNIPVDPYSPAITTLAGFVGAETTPATAQSISGSAALTFAPGAFFKSLTRDDVGGLRFLYRTGNMATEPLLADVVAGVASGATSSEFNSPWTPVISISSLATNNASANGGTGTGTTVSNALPINVTGLRPGVGKVTFKRFNYDSLVGATRNPYLISWQDRYVTNGAIRVQQVSRVVTHPDLIISAADITDTSIIALRTPDFVNNSTINTDGTGGSEGVLSGPGTISSPGLITFNSLGRYYVGGSQANARLGLSLGSFDGSTNAPILYPSGLSLKQLELLVRQGR